jgi:hypothetical protein
MCIWLLEVFLCFCLNVCFVQEDVIESLKRREVYLKGLEVFRLQNHMT